MIINCFFEGWGEGGYVTWYSMTLFMQTRTFVSYTTGISISHESSLCCSAVYCQLIIAQTASMLRWVRPGWASVLAGWTDRWWIGHKMAVETSPRMNIVFMSQKAIFVSKSNHWTWSYTYLLKNHLGLVGSQPGQPVDWWFLIQNYLQKRTKAICQRANDNCNTVIFPSLKLLSFLSD